ncbi:hypothetical protein HYALB_00008155 [Hymenoscyphus albidus]|uniref:GPI anchored protein n=1 Tax=Hymenoscyphus albidus TaxID=595503 RepID=A0A9N9LZW5_9HELO|nr:hypothetical protein HYALB_00008155 [Hymenoscyphus albidus]
MRLDSILRLPASILLLTASHTISAESSDENENPAPWQANLDARNRAQDGFLRRRAVEEHLRMGRRPVGVMKMSEDEGEKFYMEYWQFDGDSTPSLLQASSPLRPRDDEETILLSNGTMVMSFRSPFALHTPDEVNRMDLRARGAAVLALLEKRAFICPVGTLDCSSIGYPNSCCSTSESCFKIEDTGLGPVGCCPKGSTCGGTISSCDAPNTPCAANLGGGCCIPNYTCEGVGCVQISTVIVTATPPAASTSSIVIVSPPTTSSTRPLTTSIASPSTTPISTSQTLTTTATGVPPVRPTSESISTPTSGIETLCPTGFYACSAHYDGGCCRVGRNCEKTSCPTTSSTTIISNGLTIAVPIGPAATSAHPTGACATGWTSCAQTDGGNCCPTGFQCGTASCTSLSASATAIVGKGTPNSGTRIDRGVAWIFATAALLPVFLFVV